MNFAPTNEQKMVREMVRKFAEMRIKPIAAELDRTHRHPEEICRELGELGLMGVAVPTEYGGAGMDNVTYVMALIEISEACASCGVITSVNNSLYGYPVKTFGTEEQKQRFIRPITSGEVKWAIGMSEPNAGSDTFAVQLRAVEEKDCFVLNGQKIWSSGAHHANYEMVYARTDPENKHMGLSVFMVDLASPGIAMRQITQMTGIGAFCEVFFDNVRVPKENLLGEKNGGWQVLLHAFGAERTYGLFAIYNAKRYLDQLIQYCNETYVDGQPLSKDPLVRSRLAQMAIEVEVGCNLGHELNWQAAQGQPTVKASNQIKVHGAAVAQRVANLGTQILGLYGPLHERSKWVRLGGRLSHEYLSTLGSSLAGGTTENSKNHIAGKAGLGLPKK